MSARPPPTRPHIGLNPSGRFSSYSTTSDWGEDDAWNSGSDEEATTVAGWRQPQSRSPPSTAPKPVPRPQQNSSSSTLASSYTHVNAPSPSSYPSRTEQQQQQPSRQGWTLITSSREGIEQGKHSEPKQCSDSDGDLIVGDLDAEELAGEDQSVQQMRTRRNSQHSPSIRADVGEILKGTCSALHCIVRVSFILL